MYVTSLNPALKRRMIILLYRGFLSEKTGTWKLKKVGPTGYLLILSFIHKHIYRDLLCVKQYSGDFRNMIACGMYWLGTEVDEWPGYKYMLPVHFPTETPWG